MQGRLIEQTRMRSGIGRRMTDSKQQAPHFYVQAEVAVDPVLQQLERINAADPPVRLTVTAVLACACAKALGAHRRFNSVWTADGLLEADDVNLGVAVALEHGLLAPAVLDAGSLDVIQLAMALRDVAERARTHKLRPLELTDGTFTLTNLGMFAVTAFTAIITPPQVATLATARPVRRPPVDERTPGAASIMTVTLSADHRVVDGADAARWLETFKALVEAPEPLLAEHAQTDAAVG
jgi:pyruvate dehydrogenase E2 component (dihydrolipoamide acetyltransferase)